ncbi:MAG TPA: EamA family transporter [Candidatus Sulfotelmatobacter sp.]|nr:EamA family transporter [Candidatus Sulfotelmatobacter sp.]
MTSKPAPAILAASQGSTARATAARPHRVMVILAFFCIWVVWGSTYLAIRYAVATIPPLYTAGVRHLIAGSILLLWCAWKKKRPTWAQVRASIVIGFLFFLIGHGALHWAETVVPSGLAALLIAIEPIFVFGLSEAADRRFRLNLPLIAGVVLGLGGVALLFGKGVLTSAPGMGVGALAILIGAFSWSIGIVYSRRSHLSGHPLLLSALSLVSGAIMLLAAGTIAGEARWFTLAAVTGRSWGALAYLVVFGSLVTFTAYNWLLEHYPPTLVATHTYVNPIVAVLLGWLLAGERVTLNLGIAAAMVIAAVWLVDRGMAQLNTSEDIGA